MPARSAPTASAAQRARSGIRRSSEELLATSVVTREKARTASVADEAGNTRRCEGCRTGAAGRLPEIQDLQTAGVGPAAVGRRLLQLVDRLVHAVQRSLDLAQIPHCGRREITVRVVEQQLEIAPGYRQRLFQFVRDCARKLDDDTIALDLELRISLVVNHRLMQRCRARVALREPAHGQGRA